MDKKNILKEQKVNQINLIETIKSKYILALIFNNLKKKNYYKIIKYNKKIQKEFNLNIKDYKEFSEIIIEIIPNKKYYGSFIHFADKKDESFAKIYLNDNNNDIKRSKIKEDEINKIGKIKIHISNKIKSFHKLFYYCKCIESIDFKNFNREDITDMSLMFYECNLLKDLSLSQFITKNVTDMSYMFFNCNSLKQLNLSNFTTNKVTDMNNMFYNCSSLKELDLSNFRTNNVNNMKCMFCRCSSLTELNISNFNTENVTNMYYMFSRCSLLKELNLSNFNTFNVTDMKGMFYYCPLLQDLNIKNFEFINVQDIKDMFSNCSDELKNNIKFLYKDIKEEAFN